MFSFGNVSLSRLALVDHNLQLICHELIKHYDVSVISGFRGKPEQDELFRTKKSTKKWPKSKHNFNSAGMLQPLSMAVDLAPYPIDWNDLTRFVYMAGLFKGIAAANDIPIIWGGDWNNNGIIITDQTFNDYGHFELVLQEV